MEFIAPDFIAGNDPEEIQERMMSNLPADIDKMPGGFPYDFTMPTALEKSELIQFQLVRTLMLMFPMWAWGEWLDYHAQAAGIERRPAGYASGHLQIKGTPGTVIQEGAIFATAATPDSSSIEFRAVQEYIITDAGEIDVNVVAVLAGKASNVGAGTVVLASRPIKGITSITNIAQITGGTETEDDESLRDRIQEANKTKGASYVGCDADYIRWSKEVTSVGSCLVVPEWDGPGTVKLVILDMNGQPANEQLQKDVYDYIVSPNDRLQRKAPIGATVTVVAPDILSISYSAKVSLLSGYEANMVKDAFAANLLLYYEKAQSEGVIKYTKLVSVLSNTEGIYDFSEFLVNGKRENIPINKDEYPSTLEIVFS